MTHLRTLRRNWWLLLPVLAGAIGFGWGTGAFEPIRITLPGSPPAIDYPAVLDLGERTVNELVTSQFQIVNHGGQELVITHVKASCSCGKLEREIDNRSEAIKEMRLSPGERADMVVHTSIRANAAGTYNQTIAFRTNDPTQPEGRITLVFRTPSGGLRVYPTAVQFGRLLIGQKSRRMVDILDQDQHPQEVTNVVSADPDRVAIRWIPAKTKERRGGAMLLGQVEVVPNTDKQSLLDTAVRIEFANPKIQAATIHISGRVRRKVEVTPESLVLPLSSQSGPVYTGNCLVRLADERPWRLEIDSVPPGLKVALPEAPQSGTQVVRITWEPSSGTVRGATKKTVHLRAKAGMESQTIQIPVICEYQ